MAATSEAEVSPGAAPEVKPQEQALRTLAALAERRSARGESPFERGITDAYRKVVTSYGTGKGEPREVLHSRARHAMRDAARAQRSGQHRRAETQAGIACGLMDAYHRLRGLKGGRLRAAVDHDLGVMEGSLRDRPWLRRRPQLAMDDPE